MLSANSPYATYLAAAFGLVSLGLFSGAIPTDPDVSVAFQFGTAVAYTAAFYFLGRARTAEVVEYSWTRGAIGFLVSGAALLLWVGSRVAFRIDLTAPGTVPRALLALTIAGFAVGLAGVGWTTGVLAESLAIKRAREDDPR